jgi:biotin synthase
MCKSQDLIKKSQSGAMLGQDELCFLLGLPADSAASYAVMAEAARISKELSGGKAEIHAQFAVNLAPCACNCMFCSFAQKNGVFKNSSEISLEQALLQAQQFEADGAHALYMMATAHYALERFVELAQELRKQLRPETVLIANVGDQSLNNARRLKEAGFAGVYHAVRLGEGKDTGLDPEKRKQSIRNFQEAGLSVGTCVEPVGPEHSNEDLAAMIAFTASLKPAFSGAARRISIPGTELARRGMITELRMAQIVAVTRLGMPRSVLGNCTHEPCTLGALAGANLFWAETGANPRDTEEKTEEGRGESVPSCTTLFQETGWEVWAGPSRFFR